MSTSQAFPSESRLCRPSRHVRCRPPPAWARLAAAVAVLAGCNLEIPVNIPSPDGWGTVSGRVVTLDGRPVAVAAVSVPGGADAVADSLGWFSVSGVRAAERAAVSVTSDAFVSTTAIYPVQGGGETFRTVQLIPRAQAQRVDAARGGEVALGRGGSVSLEPGSLVDPDGRPAEGEVFVRATYIDPTDPAQVRAAPGDYLSTVREGGGAPLQTLGMAEIRVTDRAGRVLRLADDRTATLVWPTVQDVPGASMYRMNAGDGLWDRQSVQVTGGGRTRIPDLRPSWNWDFAYPFVCVKVDTKAPGVHVVAQGVSYAGTSGAWADGSGIAILGVRASSTVDIGVVPANQMATQRITAPAGPLVPANSTLTSAAKLQAACPTPIPVVATLTIDRSKITQHQIDAIRTR